MTKGGLHVNIAERQKAEYRRLKGCLKDLDGNKLKTYDKLLKEASFLTATLEGLRETISKEGVTETYKNGANQYGQKISATVTTYDKLLNTYSKVIAQISKGLPEESFISLHF